MLMSGEIINDDARCMYTNHLITPTINISRSETRNKLELSRV